MSFSVQLVGSLIMIGALLYAAFLSGVPTPWIVVGSMVTLGASILTAVKFTRQNVSAS